MFNITSKHFSFFNNAPTASRVAHITRDFIAGCYSCSYYSSYYDLMLHINKHVYHKTQSFDRVIKITK